MKKTSNLAFCLFFAISLLIYSSAEAQTPGQQFKMPELLIPDLTDFEGKARFASYDLRAYSSRLYPEAVRIKKEDPQIMGIRIKKINFDAQPGARTSSFGVDNDKRSLFWAAYFFLHF